MTKTVNSNIRAEMARAGLNSNRMSELALFSPTGLSRRLAGKVPLTLPELERIARVLGVPMSTLLAGTDPTEES